MIQPIDEHDIVTRCVQADGRLMEELAATHGLEFAAAFRIDYANEIANAIRTIAHTSADDGKYQDPSLFSSFRAQPDALRPNLSMIQWINCSNPTSACCHWRHPLLQRICRRLLHGK